MKRLDEEGSSSGKPSEGIMSTMGYRVGDTQGIKKEYRQLILLEILKGPLPFVDSPSYMREWGADSSIMRFNKLKRFFNGEINSPLQRNNHRAITEWKNDLAWAFCLELEPRCNGLSCTSIHPTNVHQLLCKEICLLPTVAQRRP